MILQQIVINATGKFCNYSHFLTRGFKVISSMKIGGGWMHSERATRGRWRELSLLWDHSYCGVNLGP